VEKRYFAPSFNANATYEPGAQIYDPVTVGYWVCLVTTTAGQNPTNTPASWGALAIGPASYAPVPPPNTPILLPRLPMVSWNPPAQVRNDITGLTYGGTPLTGVATAGGAVALGTIPELGYYGFPQYVQLLAGTNPMLSAAGAVVTPPSDYNAGTNNVKWLVIPPDGMGETSPINAVLEIYPCYDPTVYSNEREIPYRYLGNGWVYVQSYWNGGAVWVLLKKPVPVFTLNAYNSSTAYAAGQTVFFNGDTYVDTYLGGTITNKTPGPISIFWTLLPFPERFFEYCARAAAAEWKAKTGMKEQDVQAALQRAENAFTELNINFVQEENQGKFLGKNMGAWPRSLGHGCWGSAP
jgi:hypothetical protein